jgi:hypothetical protein
MVDQIESRFSKSPDYVKDRERLIRDLLQLVDDLNASNSDLQAQITVLKNRIDAASIP